MDRNLLKRSNRDHLVAVLRNVIRHMHSLDKQIRRKYQSYQVLEQYREDLKKRIKQISFANLKV